MSGAGASIRIKVVVLVGRSEDQGSKVGQWKRGICNGVKQHFYNVGACRTRATPLFGLDLYSIDNESRFSKPRVSWIGSREAGAECW